MKYKYSFSDFPTLDSSFFSMIDYKGFRIPVCFPPLGNFPSPSDNGYLVCVGIQNQVHWDVLPLVPWSQFLFCSVNSSEYSSYELYLLSYLDTLFACTFPSLDGLGRRMTLNHNPPMLDYVPYVGKFIIESPFQGGGSLIVSAFDTFEDAFLEAVKLYISSPVTAVFDISYIKSYEGGFIYFVPNVRSVMPVISLSCCPLDYSPIIQLLGGQ